MVKVKTSISMEQEVWKAFCVFTIQRTGSARKMSELVEEAIRNYMIDPRVYPGPEGESFLCVKGAGTRQAH